MNSGLQLSLKSLGNVGYKRAEAFAKINILTIEDLLNYFPTRYLDRTNLLSAMKVIEYVRNGYEGEVTIIGKVIDNELIKYARKPVFKVSMTDGDSLFECVWFQGLKFFKDRFRTGESYAVSAKPRLTKYGHLQFVHPDFDKLGKDETTEFKNTGRIIPFYRMPKELKANKLGDIGLRNIIYEAVEKFCDEIAEPFPESLLIKNKLPLYREAVRNIHIPEDQERLKKAIERIKYNELFFFECLVALRRNKVKVRTRGIKFEIFPAPVKKLIDNLGFSLTEAQLRVLSEIKKDMISPEPMNRLLQGDVGSGKTVVALLAMMIAVTNGYQAAIMAPTEILAHQHYLNFEKLLKGSGIKCVLVTGGMKAAGRRKALKEIVEGDAGIIIGTHAIFEEAVNYKKVGLVVIDEQHRFGVLQRMRIIEKGNSPDVLVMTATPIPRSLSMTYFGDLDLSVIDELPPGRKTIKTILRGEARLPAIYKFIIDKTTEGNQAYVVYPLVEESEVLELKAALEQYEFLKETYFKDIRVGLLHGRMHWQEKEEEMLKFARGEYDVLVSTTVIEVGIDVPSANIMVINDAYRFGLSQLHQLRGRVGRGGKQGYCVLIGKDENVARMGHMNFNFEYLSAAQIEKFKAAIRLNAMVKYSSGFDLSEIDLKLRGPGQIFGTQQSGMPELKYADLSEDGPLLIKAKEDAFAVIESDPRFELPENSGIRAVLVKDYADNLRYSEIG